MKRAERSPLSLILPSSPETRPAPEPSDSCRCACGSLLARLVPSGVEIKCRRCKRTLVIPLEAEVR